MDKISEPHWGDVETNGALQFAVFLCEHSNKTEARYRGLFYLHYCHQLKDQVLHTAWPYSLSPYDFLFCLLLTPTSRNLPAAVPTISDYVFQTNLISVYVFFFSPLTPLVTRVMHNWWQQDLYWTKLRYLFRICKQIQSFGLVFLIQKSFKTWSGKSFLSSKIGI